MATEITPTGDGLELQTKRTTTPEFGSVTELGYSGPVASLEELEAQLKASALLDGTVGSMVLTHARGRGTLAVNYQRVWGTIDPKEQMVQELNSYDVVRPIYTSEYFRSGKTDLIASIRDVHDQQLTPTEADAAAAQHDADEKAVGKWGLRLAGGKAWQLLGHLRIGMESYNETAYEFIQTWRTTSTAQLKIAASEINKVVPAPKLSGPMGRLIDDLPTGEWLKRPTTVQSAGNGIFAVRTSLLWAVKWSVVYGGTENGLDA